MRRRKKRPSFGSRQTRRQAVFAITAVLAVASLAVGAWYLGPFGAQVSAEAASPFATAAVAPTGFLGLFVPSMTAEPTAVPTPELAQPPTPGPTAMPTPGPTAALTPELTASPVPEPTAAPSAAPINPMSTELKRVIVIEERKRGLFSGVKIGIDPGHQLRGNSAQEPVAPGSSQTKAKVSSGTQGVATGIPEYEVNLQVALCLRDALEAQGAEVYLTREVNEVDISNIERATMMNELGVDVVLRLHCNGSTNQSLRGMGLYVKSAGEGAAESYAISEYLIAAMGAATGARTEPIHVSDTYSGLNWSTVPSILVEMGFMSNPEEDRLLCSEEYQTLLVQGMVSGLANYFTDHPVPEPTPASAPSETPAGSAAPAALGE